jgi:hypothetical protein
MSNYKYLLEIAKQPNLVHLSPSKDTPEDLKTYVQTATRLLP